VSLLFFPALPFSSLGLSNTIERISEHVYQDFVKQGAFALATRESRSANDLTSCLKLKTDEEMIKCTEVR
jgi:hypothetical protein